MRRLATEREQSVGRPLALPVLRLARGGIRWTLEVNLSAIWL